MNGEAIFYMLVSMVVIWGALIASAVFLAVKPEVAKWPAGAPADGESQPLD
ncbi:MAG: MetS family NSS transporter small subunit [Propionibacteriaceae bacterium]|jgi:hypothetical protein|nr:MetS family NSS transporter small subunit [Propionibacteriaceae bacterium]